MDINDYVVSECDRQHSTLYAEMAKALGSAKGSRIGFDIGSPSNLICCNQQWSGRPRWTSHLSLPLREHSRR